MSWRNHYSSGSRSLSLHSILCSDEPLQWVDDHFMEQRSTSSESPSRDFVSSFVAGRNEPLDWHDDHYSQQGLPIENQPSSGRNRSLPINRDEEPLHWVDDHYIMGQRETTRYCDSSSKDAASSSMVGSDGPIEWHPFHYAHPSLNLSCQYDRRAQQARQSQPQSRPNEISQSIAQQSEESKMETSSPVCRNWNSPIYEPARRLKSPRTPSPPRHYSASRVTDPTLLSPLRGPISVDCREGTIFYDESKVGDPLLRDAIREIAVYIVSSAVGDFSLVMDFTQVPQIHDIPKYRDIMVFATKTAEEPVPYMLNYLRSYVIVEAYLDKLNKKTYQIYNEFKHQDSLYQEELQEYLSTEVIYPELLEYKWMNIAQMFYVVRRSALLVRDSDANVKHKLELFRAILDGCFFAIKAFEHIDKIFPNIEEYKL